MSQGPYAVVVSDLRMPGMDGVILLYLIRQAAPDTVRVLLTGKADLEAATLAINEGNIFRLLNKPCPTVVFSGRWKPPLNSTDRKVEPDVGKSSVHRCRTGPTLGVSALAPQGVWSHHSSGRRGCVDHDSASGPLRGGWTVIHRHNLNSGRGAPKCEPNRKCGRIESSELIGSVLQARSSARLERYLDTVEVWGSSPHGPTNAFNNLPKARPREISNCNVDCNVTASISMSVRLCR